MFGFENISIPDIVPDDFTVLDHIYFVVSNTHQVIMSVIQLHITGCICVNIPLPQELD
jgi:hypothetical protein